MPIPTHSELETLAKHIKQWGRSLGFQAVGICKPDLHKHQAQLQQWLDAGYHGEMGYMANHTELRCAPDKLHPGTLRVISVRIDYLPQQPEFATTLEQPQQAYISRYAAGRDYHKLLRKRLNQLGKQIAEEIEGFDCRPFVDSAPLLERPLAEMAGLGWVGKHTLLLNQDAGSFFFLGELLVNLPLPIDQPSQNQCGNCVACIRICPTQAIIAPYQMDARRCISYLTIEHGGAIPLALRPALGNRIYGCDDCQLICPWNRFAQHSAEAAFSFKSIWQDHSLLSLFQWDEAQFLKNTEGTPIRRIGYQRWQRNLAVAIGNAPYDPALLNALQSQPYCSEMVQEHIDWAIAEQQKKSSAEVAHNRLTQRLIRSVRKGLLVDNQSEPSAE